MRILLDSNLLLRGVQLAHPMYQPAVDAMAALQAGGDTLCIVPQNLYEFWVVYTRPVAANGLGKSPSQAVAELNNLKTFFTILDDTPAVCPEWEQLVSAHAILGKNAHDARLVAAMLVHGVTHLLTFNDADFRRFPSRC